MEATTARITSSPAPARSVFRAGAVAIWFAAAVAAAALLGLYNFSRLGAAFDAEARTIHRILSQRADQHEAHLTSLAAVVGASDEIAPALRPIAESVLRFYPRITAIDVVALRPSPGLIFTTRETGPGPEDPRTIAAVAEGLQPGQTLVRRQPKATDYALVKRVPSGAIVMMIDGLRLSSTEDALPDGAVLSLTAPSGEAIARLADEQTPASLLPAFSFEKTLGSRSQPLGLSLQRRPALGEVLPLTSLLGVIGGTGATVLLGWIVLRERRAAHEASRQAAFHARDARFAHAARVNTVGEMALGIVHELTQPLTAILSQSQAGLRLAGALKAPQEIIGVLEANAKGAKRAGDILARLREYIANRAPEPQPTELNDVVRHVAQLTKPDLDQRGIALTLRLEPGEPHSLVDRVSIEQVIHNLLLNAIDAVDGLPEPRRTISVTTELVDRQAFITVRDMGEGIAPGDLPRLFEPFFTTKSGGMGLGLPICERLVESFGGQIAAANDPDGGAVFTVRLPASV